MMHVKMSDLDDSFLGETLTAFACNNAVVMAGATNGVST